MAAGAFLAVFCCGLFAGAAIYITFVEHPARMECGTALAATVLGPSYRRAAIMQASLAALSFVGSIVAWRAEENWWWLLGGTLLAAVIPFTLLVIFPTNSQLLNRQLDRDSEETRRLLVRWGRLHAIRTLLSILALVVFLYILIRTHSA